MKKICSLSLAFLFAVLVMPIGLQASVLSDISSHKNRTAIEYLNENGIVEGYEDGSYKPDASINRAEFTKIIIEATYDYETIEGCLPQQMKPEWTYTFFPDVDRNAWYAKYVCVAKTENIVGGYEDGLFRPENQINKAEAIKIIVNSQGYNVPETVKGNAYSDVFSDDWFAPYVQAASDANLIEDTGSAALSPGQALTRAGMSEMTYRAMVSEGGTFVEPETANEPEMTEETEMTTTEEETSSDTPMEPGDIIMEILNTENTENIEDQILSMLDTPEENYVRNQLLADQLRYEQTGFEGITSVRGLMYLYLIEEVVGTSVSIAEKDKAIIGVKTKGESSEGEEMYQFSCFPLVLNGETWKLKMPMFFTGDVGFTTPGVKSTCLKEIELQPLWSEGELVPAGYSSISPYPIKVYLNGDLIDYSMGLAMKIQNTYLPLKAGSNTLEVVSLYDDPYEMDWTGTLIDKDVFESSFELEPDQMMVQIVSDNDETLVDFSMLKSEGSKTVEFEYQP